jgi:hypothetical protein
VAGVSTLVAFLGILAGVVASTPAVAGVGLNWNGATRAGDRLDGPGW